MADDRCKDCERHVRIVFVGWDRGPNRLQIPLDFVKSPKGEYAVVGPETAVFVRFEDRHSIGVPLYTDHRRTCPNRSAGDDPDRPQMAKVRIACGVCQSSRAYWCDAIDALKSVQNFVADHVNCRMRKAS